jgi:hypothetical protein
MGDRISKPFPDARTLQAELEVGSSTSPVVDPMEKTPAEEVVVPIPLESCTVTTTPDRTVPEVFFTVPDALHPQDWPIMQPTRTAEAATAAASKSRVRLDFSSCFAFGTGYCWGG